MITISGGRGIGKTKLLLETAKAEGGVIVCRDPEQMRDRAHKYGITGLEIISYEDLYTNRVISEEKHLYIHDINKFITYNFPEVKGYTLCNE
jgi:predicted ATP-dependent serine protease